MHEEDGKPRYYAEVSLFATGMLGTVSADNFLQLLIFWEIMGLCSYLLIGFWYSKPEVAAAAKKAFLVTRVGDVLFLVGVLVIWNVFGTLSFGEIQGKMASLYPNPLTPQLLTLIPLLLFGGAVGKSAQFPLHAWLPAGAYIMATEVSRGEATNSAGYSAALYDLFNHAFFKALLFLGAGSVIHAVATNDMREMGGLAKPMPVTSKVMLFGALALAGIVPFSGFFSKGEILSVTFEAGAENPGFYLLYALGVGTAFLTAFYAFRLWFMTFHGTYRGHVHPHESPRVMTVPLMIVGGFAVVYGTARALDWFDRKVIDGIVNGVGRAGVIVATGTDRFDRQVIDGAVNAVSLETVRTSLRLRQRQTGQVQSYAWVVVLGIVVVIALMFGLSFLQRWWAGLGR